MNWNDDPPVWLVGTLLVLVALSWLPRFRRDRTPLSHQLLIYAGIASVVASFTWNLHVLGYVGLGVTAVSVVVTLATRGRDR